MTTYQVATDFCETCGEKLDAATYVGGPGDAPPSARNDEIESLSICANCGTLYAFDERRKLERLEDVPAKASDETRALINRTRAAIFLFKRRGLA